ncbi:MAG: hypothetical protein ACUVYA_00990 [Planctomycetota bacterium]
MITDDQAPDLADTAFPCSELRRPRSRRKLHRALGDDPGPLGEVLGLGISRLQDGAVSIVGKPLEEAGTGRVDRRSSCAELLGRLAGWLEERDAEIGRGKRTVNARAVIDPAELERIAQDEIERAAGGWISVEVQELTSFHPGRSSPTHRSSRRFERRRHPGAGATAAPDVAVPGIRRARRVTAGSRLSKRASRSSRSG